MPVAVPKVTLSRLPFSVPLVPDSVKPSGSDKEEGGKEARDSRLSGSGRMKFFFSLSYRAALDRVAVLRESPAFFKAAIFSSSGLSYYNTFYTL